MAYHKEIDIEGLALEMITASINEAKFILLSLNNMHGVKAVSIHDVNTIDNKIILTVTYIVRAFEEEVWKDLVSKTYGGCFEKIIIDKNGQRFFPESKEMISFQCVSLIQQLRGIRSYYINFSGIRDINIVFHHRINEELKRYYAVIETTVFFDEDLSGKNLVFLPRIVLPDLSVKRIYDENEVDEILDKENI